MSPAEIPRVWLQRACSDLALAKAAVEVPGVFLEDACFHTQQCAEKALKALLFHMRFDVPRTHALELLLDVLRDGGVAVPPEIDETFFLSQYAVETRYPGEWEPVTDEEMASALDAAARVLAWVETIVDSEI